MSGMLPSAMVDGHGQAARDLGQHPVHRPAALGQ
jgi:hypothetical protein